MIDTLKKTLWKQFGASIEMLENALVVCPDEMWDTKSLFWYNAYHCLFFLDYYLTVNAEIFAPPAPFTLSEFDSAGAIPERVYSKEELLDYLYFCKEKCHDVISTMTNETAQQTWVNRSGSMQYPFVELLMYNMRHVQHHTGQLNLLLRQGINDAPNWVSRTKVVL